MNWSGVYLALGQWFNQTLCVSHFNELILGSFGNIPVNKSRHYVLYILPGLLRYRYIMNHRIKAYNMCYMIHWLDQRYICDLTSDLSGHHVLANLMGWFWANLKMDQWVKSDTMC